MIKSKALEINIETYRVEVTIDPKYSILQEITSKYYGLLNRLNTFLEELSHPYKNWECIVKEARGFSLDYFYLLKKHEKGPVGTKLFIDIFFDAISHSKEIEVKSEAVDNLLLFIEKIINDSGSELSRFKTVLDDAFDRIRACDAASFSLFVKSYYPINRIAEKIFHLLQDSLKTNDTNDYSSLTLLLVKYLDYAYAFWLDQEDPEEWFKKEAGIKSQSHEINRLFSDISHGQLEELRKQIEEIRNEENIGSVEILSQLTEFPGHSQFVKIYRDIPKALFEQCRDDTQGNLRKLIFLFLIMNTQGLSLIHEETLRMINRTLTWLITKADQHQVRKLINKTFLILKKLSAKYPETVLNCVFNVGEGVYKTDDNELIAYFHDFVIDLGFQSPMITGVSNTWQIKVNRAHIQNVRIWLELIGQKPQWSARLLSALIIQLSVSGVFIKDTDLFPRDITRFLNSDISPVYNLAKQLARLLPAFFNDIGAEGKLRDISTQLDELCHRKDVLVHFLRKQSHVESNNRIISLMETIIEFWKTRDKKPLEPFVPPDIYNQINPDDESGSEIINGLHKIVNRLAESGIVIPNGLLKIEEDELNRHSKNIQGVSEGDIKKVFLAIEFYKLLNQKYNFDCVELDNCLSQFSASTQFKQENLRSGLEEKNLRRKLFKLLYYLEYLKSLILDKTTFDVHEDIYKKRHIAFDIPSMYGSYHETKFDALGLSLRLESVINVYFEELVDSFDLSLITKETFYKIFNRLILFEIALKNDGITSGEMERQLNLLGHSLEMKEFTFTQYLDIFNGFAKAVKNIINDHFNNIHEQNLTRILSALPVSKILRKYLPAGERYEGVKNTEKLKHRVSEIFFRERLATSLGLQQLDLFLSRILNTLFLQSEKLPDDKLHQLLNYDPNSVITQLDPQKSKNYGIIHVGNKGLNLIKLDSYGWPIPPGFIITTEAFRFKEIINCYPPALKNFRQQIADHLSILEKISGKSFGNPENPLLLSVRSGSTISQPGMMDTFLNVGINEEIVEGIILNTGNPWFAWDNYRRFLQGYGMSFGLDRNDFDSIIDDFKQTFGVPVKKAFTGEQMKQVALAYRDMLIDAGIEILTSPFEQLYLVIQHVFKSWESQKAKTYRKIIGISDDWGTAVTIQKMVFGNISEHSGTGVLFTHSPKMAGDTLRLWGDFSIGNQGEDVVSGLVKTLAISDLQKSIEQRGDDRTLESDFPEIYAALKKMASELIYKKGWSPQEMEFTFESSSEKDLYILQTRDMEMRERKKVINFELEEILSTKSLMGHGIGVSGGAMNGRIVFSLEEIEKWRQEEPNTSLILIRNDTVPDDIYEISEADGLLTARGGLTSHAAVVAHRLGKTCVVGCRNMLCNEKNHTGLFDKVTLKTGDHISIDGREGSVYKGSLKIAKT